jgi:hypothetical protein
VEAGKKWPVVPVSAMIGKDGGSTGDVVTEFTSLQIGTMLLLPVDSRLDQVGGWVWVAGVLGRRRRMGFQTTTSLGRR